MLCIFILFFFFKQKTAYEMRISDWSSDVCSSDLLHWAERLQAAGQLGELERLMLQATYGEYLSQLTGGIALSQVEVLRPGDLGMSDAEVAALATPAVRRLTGNGNALRMAIAGHLNRRSLRQRPGDYQANRTPGHPLR